MKPQQYLNTLKAIQKSNSRGIILSHCSNDIIKAICECVLNLLKGNIIISKHQKDRLVKHRQDLRKLVRKKVPLYKEREILVQKGGSFLGLLLPAAITAITSLIHGSR